MTKLTPDQMIERAAVIAVRAHQHQKRKDGTPYIAHCIVVAIRCDGKIAGAIGLLHDVIEDTDYTLDQLREDGFTDEVVDALDALSKRPGEKYFDFICRIIAAGPLAIRCKLADISHNLEDQSALEPDEAAFLRDRYTKAQEMLEAAL